jgi:hypothetical protein
MASRLWTRQETELALYLYFQTTFGRSHQRNPEIIKLAQAIDRTPSSVAMKLSNFASLDPEITGSGRSGLKGASTLDREVFAQFLNNWEGLVAECSRRWEDIVANDTAARVVRKDDQLREFSQDFGQFPANAPSTASRVVEVRRGQQFFRRAVLANYGSKCCITGIADERLLNASHIKPWTLDEVNRHNPANGLALSATFDRAFDRGLMTVMHGEVITFSRQLLEHRSQETREYFKKFEGKTISPASRFAPDADLIKWHNDWFVEAGA